MRLAKDMREVFPHFSQPARKLYDAQYLLIDKMSVGTCCVTFLTALNE
jgi:hypothetical protein